MLVLSRKVNESIIIGGNIRVTMTAIRSHQVRLSIEAPADVRILRQELLADPTPAEPGRDPLPGRPRRAHRTASPRPGLGRPGR